ncbi:MAG: hypothetical protein JWO05_1122 [Gemmatimonadetes bacterium]|nr:hypothetical protein [Gemmatimonadota bacterium]
MTSRISKKARAEQQALARLKAIKVLRQGIKVLSGDPHRSEDAVWEDLCTLRYVVQHSLAVLITSDARWNPEFPLRAELPAWLVELEEAFPE